MADEVVSDCEKSSEKSAECDDLTEKSEKKKKKTEDVGADGSPMSTDEDASGTVIMCLPFNDNTGVLLMSDRYLSKVSAEDPTNRTFAKMKKRSFRAGNHLLAVYGRYNLGVEVIKAYKKVKKKNPDTDLEAGAKFLRDSLEATSDMEVDNEAKVGLILVGIENEQAKIMSIPRTLEVSEVHYLEIGSSRGPIHTSPVDVIYQSCLQSVYDASKEIIVDAILNRPDACGGDVDIRVVAVGNLFQRLVKRMDNLIRERKKQSNLKKRKRQGSTSQAAKGGQATSR